jgi:parallel beta-helix repeat protein
MGSYRLVLLGVVVFALGVAGGGAASAGTIRVPADKPTIQAAIDAAVDGDVVVVAKGTYNEHIDFLGKAITVKSTNPLSKTVVAATIIDGQSIELLGVVTFGSGESATSVLSGFTITRGNGQFGGGVVCDGSSPSLTNNVITDNMALWGGGVVCTAGSAPAVTNNTISANRAADYGGGVACVASAPTLTGNIITANSADDGGGVFCFSHSSPVLASNTISGNRAFNDGGGLCCDEVSSPKLTNNTLSGNSADGSGGGVYCHDNSSPTLKSNTVTGNQAVYGGGGLECNNRSSATLTNNIISGNVVTNGYGGGVMCYDHASPPVTNNTIVANAANLGGGGVCAAHGSSPVLKNSIMAFNTQGGGLYVYVAGWADPCNPVVTYSDFYNNTGGDYVQWPSQTGAHGNISKNPLFASLAGGDYHEKSKGGRWNPKTSAWVNDAVHSPCIDKGAPSSAFGKEPTPNGGRINMGAYGNTTKASKAPPTVATAAVVLTATADATGSGACQITLSLSAPASAQVSVLNVAGRTVAALPPRDLPEGVSALVWDGRSTGGTKAPAGRYLIRVSGRTESGAQTSALATVMLR